MQAADARLSVQQRFRIALARSMRLLAKKQTFDESEHPRDAHGRWTDTGGAAFVSPNVDTLNFDAALAGINSKRQQALRRASADVDVRLGKNPVEAENVVGAWADGAENSLMLTMPKDWSHEQSRVALAMKGWLGDQKSALLFTPDQNGNAYVASFPVSGKLDDIHHALLDDGLAFHTLEPTSDGALVHVYGDDQATADAVDKAAGKHDAEAQFTFGNGEFIGTTKDGSDREQRDDARREYEAIIAEAQAGSAFEGRDVGKIWDDIRARWGRELSPPQVTDATVPGHRLTSNALVEEAGDVKPNSKKVTTVAKEINARAGKIIKQDLGLDYIDLDNHTDKTDDYVAGVLAQELKDGLTNGRSAVDWYDRSMREAMATAEKLYPGMAKDPDKRFIYTAALAITSQGEVVDSSVRLADQAYTHFAEHGKFPTDLKVADPTITVNLKKVNALIDKMGVARARELFDKQMTVRDLKKLTGYGVSGMGMDDMVYGSAVLGPKIGQGFYQNLNGNFGPITMDLWFMRSWGRVTNTGLGETDMVPVIERFDNALKYNKLPVPKSQAAKLKLAREIFEQHEDDYKEHQADYKSGKRDKSELVHAAERFVYHADGAMVEMPKGVQHRRWITEVFHKALGKLNAEGIRLNPASAQATWWWPEKVLWDKLGVRVRELDMDYAKSLRKLADSRGVKRLTYAMGPGFVPWIDDPDPPDAMTDDEIAAMAERAAADFKTDKSLQQDWWQQSRAQALHVLAKWNEADHPRGQPENAGQFGPGGGGSGSATGGGQGKPAAQGKPTAAAPVKTPSGQKIQGIADSVAQQLGFPAERIDVVGGNDASLPYGSASPQTGRISLYADKMGEDFQYSPKAASGIVAHEIMHQKFFFLLKKAREDGEDSEAFKLAVTHAKTFEARSQKGATVSKYAKLFWDKVASGEVKSTLTAENETLAEMARIEFETGKVKGSKEWKAYYRDVNSFWAANNAGMTATKSADAIEIAEGPVFAYLTRDFEPATKQAHDIVKIIKPDRTWFMPPNYWDNAKKPADKRLWVAVRSEAQALLARTWNEADHPRVPAGSSDGGQFGGGGGGDSPDIPDVHLDPNVVEVGGDAWNKATAKRLEREYQAAKPKLEAMLDKVEGSGGDVGGKPDEDESDDAAYIPESWAEMSDDDQQYAAEAYYEQKLNDYVESESNNWHENGGALDEAKAELAGDDEWKTETLKKILEDSETKFPYDAFQLDDAISLNYDSDGEGGGDLTVTFDDSMLMEPTGAPPKEQQTLPGIEPEDLSQRLTEDMREELQQEIGKAFDEKAQDKSSDMSPPEYLAESAQEYMHENWENGMTDEDKFAFVKQSTDIIKEDKEQLVEAGADETIPVKGLPKKYDPLNDTSGADYQKTQKLARMISLKRAEQVLKDRNLPYPGFAAMRSIDNELWSAWKSSSTSFDGQLLQVATADELGGRLNPTTGRGGIIKLDRDKIITDADGNFKAIGGYAGVKAYVRAKWETTQFLLDKAGIKELELYRGIALDKDKLEQADREKLVEVLDIARKQMVEGFAKVPNLTVVRNGAASTTTNPSVANTWSGDGTRVVLRAHVPRTAAISIPAYGINVKSEQEVVVAGTAWKAWDAWLGRAPEFKRVAMAA